MFGSGGVEQVQVSGTLEEDDYMRFGLVSKIASLADEILRHVFRHGTGERSGRCLRSSAESRCDDQHENAEIELPQQRHPPPRPGRGKQKAAAITAG